MMDEKSLKKLAYWGIPALLVFLALLGLGQAGWRIGAGGVYRTAPAVILLSVPEPDSTVFLDNRRIKTTANADEVVELKSTEGDHTLMVGRDGAWPWQKKLFAEGGTTTSAAAFTTLTPPYVTRITADHPEHAQALEAFREHFLPSPTNQLLDPTESVAIWADTSDNTLHANWRALGGAPQDYCGEDAHEGCPSSITFFTARNPIGSLTFYRGRSDVAILAAGTEVFGLDITARSGNQNFHPIYSGTAPKVVARDATSLYLKDGDTLLIVQF